MNSPVIKRSIVVNGHKTSISLEDAFWAGIKAVAAQRKTTISDLVSSIDRSRQGDAGNLSSTLRVFVLEQCRTDAQAKDQAIGSEHRHAAG